MAKPYADFILVRVVAVALVSLSSSYAFAQGGANGSIIGSVYDQTGQPIKGVKVIAKSPTQIGGQKVAYTNDEGAFRIVGLQPGTFELSATAPKLRPAIQKDIAVGITAPSEVDIVLEVETQTEVIEVTEKARIVSTTSATVKQVFDADFVDNLPQDDRHAVEATVGDTTPGAISYGRSASIRGGQQNQTQFQLEGFMVNGQKIAQKALAAFEVQSAGYGAENATASGGVVNMVTKSGSNKFELDLSGFAEDTHFQFFRDSGDGNTKLHGWNYYLSPQFGGPLIKDRVWYFAQFEARSTVYQQGADPSGFFPQRSPQAYLSLRGSVKLTWQVTPRNKLQNFSQVNRTYTKNNIGGFNVDPEAQQASAVFDYFSGFIWESLLTDKLFLRSQIGVSQFFRKTEPQSCIGDNIQCDHTIPVIQQFPQTEYLNNWYSHDEIKEARLQIVNTLEWYASSKRLGEHSLQLKDDFYTVYQETSSSTPGDEIDYYSGVDPSRRTVFFSNDPRLEEARYGWFIKGSSGTRNALSLRDMARFSRHLTLTPALAFVTAHGTNNHSDEAINRQAWSPSLSAAYDPTHDGRTVLRASFSVLADAEVTALSQHLLGSQTTRQDSWDPVYKDWVPGAYSGGSVNTRTIGRPCGQSGIDQYGRSCIEKLRIPRTWEYTLGAEREIVQGIALGADFIYRLFSHPYVRAETNRIWNSAGTALVEGGSYRNGRAETISDLETNDSVNRRYVAMTASIHKREGALKVNSSYTWSHLTGNHTDGLDVEWGQNSGQDVFQYGDLPNDSRHTVRTTATYQLASWLSTGIVYSYSSGGPYRRLFYNDIRGFTDYRATRGINPGNNINSPYDDRPLRLPDIQKLNLQLRGNLKPFIGYKIEAYVDVINILALRTTTSVQQADTPTFGQQSSRMAPFTVRLGFGARF